MANQPVRRNGTEPLYSMSFTLFSSRPAVDRATDRARARLESFETALLEARNKPVPNEQMRAALEAAYKLALASEDPVVKSAKALYACAATKPPSPIGSILKKLDDASQRYTTAKTYVKQLESMSEALGVVIMFIEQQDAGSQRLTEPLRRLDWGLYNRLQNAPDAMLDRSGGRGRHRLDHEQVAFQMRVAAAVEIWIKGRGLKPTPAREKVHTTLRRLRRTVSKSWVRDCHQRFRDRVPFAEIEMPTDVAAEAAARDCIKNWRKDLPR